MSKAAWWTVSIVGGLVLLSLVAKLLPTPDIGPPEYSVLAADLWQEFKSDNRSANRKYAGKTIEVKRSIELLDNERFL
jgi:hypothetical protein